jgi:predicted component of type VI protein secretion system
MTEGGGARLFVLSGPDLGRSFPLPSRATLGRSDECDVVLRDRSISRKHAVLTREGGRWHVEDQGSTNGISKDGTRARRIELSDGDEFKLGDLLLRLRLGPVASEGGEIEFDLGPGRPVAGPPAPPPASRQPVPAAEEVEIEMEVEIEEPASGRPAPGPSALASAAPHPLRVERRTSLLAADLEQQPFWMRAGLVLLLCVLGLALAYGAFRAVGILRAE